MKRISKMLIFIIIMLILAPLVEPMQVHAATTTNIMDWAYVYNTSDTSHNMNKYMQQLVNKCTASSSHYVGCIDMSNYHNNTSTTTVISGDVITSGESWGSGDSRKDVWRINNKATILYPKAFRYYWNNNGKLTTGTLDVLETLEIVYGKTFNKGGTVQFDSNGVGYKEGRGWYDNKYAKILPVNTTDGYAGGIYADGNQHAVIKRTFKFYDGYPNNQKKDVYCLLGLSDIDDAEAVAFAKPYPGYIWTHGIEAKEHLYWYNNDGAYTLQSFNIKGHDNLSKQFGGTGNAGSWFGGAVGRNDWAVLGIDCESNSYNEKKIYALEHSQSDGSIYYYYAASDRGSDMHAAVDLSVFKPTKPDGKYSADANIYAKDGSSIDSQSMVIDEFKKQRIDGVDRVSSPYHSHTVIAPSKRGYTVSLKSVTQTNSKCGSFSSSNWTYTFKDNEYGTANQHDNVNINWNVTPNIYTIYWHTNGGYIDGTAYDGNLYNTIQCDSNQIDHYGTKATYIHPWAVPNRTYRPGYEFLGWYDSPSYNENDKGSYSGSKVWSANGSPQVGTYWSSNLLWNYAGNVHVYAHWYRIPYTVTVIDVCRSADPGHYYNQELGRKTYTYYYGDVVSGNALSGGNTAISAYYDKHVLTGDDGAKTVTGNTTLYRYFERPSYTVTFEDIVQRETESDTVRPSSNTKANGYKLGGTTKTYWYGQTANLSDYSGTDTGKNKYYTGFLFDHASAASVVVTSDYKFTRYFRYNPWIVTYDVNQNPGDGGSVAGGTAATVRYTYFVDTRTDTHTGIRPGWTFRGWNTNPNAKEWYRNDVASYVMPNDNTTLYGIYNRSFVIHLHKDYFGRRNGSDSSLEIWNHDTVFKYDWNDFINEMTRGDGLYIATFVNNNVEDEDGTIARSEIIDMGSTSSSSNYNSDTSKIEAYPTFRGWSTSDFRGGTIIAGSGSYINVTPNPGTEHGYTITGNSGSVYEGNLANNEYTLYAQYNDATIKLPDARRHKERHSDTDEYTGRDEDVFLGWFTKEQTPGATDGGVFVGRAGDEVYINDDITLYPWFNIAPEITMSSMSNVFYEGQSINYDDILALVDAKDVDDYASDYDDDGLITWSGVKSFASVYSMNLDSLLWQLGLDGDERDAIKDSINVTAFKPICFRAEFDGNGLDAQGNLYGEGPGFQDENSIKNGLDTSKRNVGTMRLYYKITDDGMVIDTINQLKGINYVNYDSLSSIKTVKYRLDSEILFNNPPTIKTAPIHIYSDDDTDDITEYILSRQSTSDLQDDRTEIPWWYHNDVSPLGEDSPNSYTQKKLDDSLTIVKISNIIMASNFEEDMKKTGDNICDVIKSCTTIDELFAYKDTNPEAFKHIKSFEVTVDSVDQWGKPASAPICGLSEIERTFPVIMFNREDDIPSTSELYMFETGAFSERLRYINLKNMDSLKTNDYWGDADYGRSKLEETFNNYRKDRKETPDSTGKIENSISSDEGRTVTINVYDYTK